MVREYEARIRGSDMRMVVLTYGAIDRLVYGLEQKYKGCVIRSCASTRCLGTIRWHRVFG